MFRSLSYRTATKSVAAGSLLFLIGGCEKPTVRVIRVATPTPAESTSAESTPNPDPSSNAKAQLDASPPATPAPSAKATPAPPRFAPQGIYYVLKPFSITTDAGIFGFRLGKRVVLVRETGENLVVTDGTVQATAPKDSFTNDLEIVSAATKQTSPEQKQPSASHEERAAAINAKNLQAGKILEAQNKDLSAKKRARLQASINALNVRIAAAQQEIADKKNSQRPIRRIYSPGGTLLSYQGHSMYTLSADASGLNRLVAERDKETSELSRLK